MIRLIKCKNGLRYALYRWNSDYISVAMGSAYPRYSRHWKNKPIVIEGKLLLRCILSVKIIDLIILNVIIQSLVN